MIPATIIFEARMAGVRLSLSSTGTIKMTGEPAAVNRWAATIREHKAEIIEALKVSPGDTPITSRWWRLHFADLAPVEVYCTPEATHAEILEQFPSAVAAEPFTPIIRQPLAPMTAEEKAAVLAWLDQSGETDSVMIAEVIGQCQRDADARDYFTNGIALPQSADVCDSTGAI